MNVRETISQYKKLIVISLTILAIALTALLTLQSSAKIGKTEVLFTTIPSDSIITIAGQTGQDKVRYLTPGEYTATIEREGFKSTEEMIVVAEDFIEVGVALFGDSDIATKYYEANPAEFEQLDGIGGVESQRQSIIIETNNPIIQDLPYTGPEELYAVDYGIPADRPDKVYVIIKNSSTSGRADAVQWIKSKGHDISTLDIRYEDYVSPLQDRKKSERGY